MLGKFVKAVAALNPGYFVEMMPVEFTAEYKVDDKSDG